MASPIALESIWLEAKTGPISRSGRMRGQGNLVDAKPKWQMPGRIIAAIQREVLVAITFFFSDFVMGGLV